MSKHILLAVLTLTALVQPSVPAQTSSVSPSDAPAQVNNLFAAMDNTTSPGCAVAAMKDGEIVYKHGYGMADLDHNVPIAPDTVFHVASMSKQFTAASIVMLAQEGKLSLDDPVRKYIPELPDFGAPITIRQLIHHTSGLRDQWELLGFAGWRYSLDLITDEDVLAVISRQKDLNFTPGSRFLYSNTGYTLLAQIVKRVSGQSLREFTAARIFEPLGMTRTHFRDDHAEVVKNIAYGYAPSKLGFRLSVTNFDTVGATSLLTTVEDLARWDENFYEARVGGSALIAQMLERGTLSDGEQLNYAFGLTVDTYRGLRVVGHSGSDAGYRSDMIRFPDQHLTAVCLCNLASAIPDELTRKVAEIYLRDSMVPVVKTEGSTDERAKSVQLSESQLRSKVGLYLNTDQITQKPRVTFKNGTLRINDFEAWAIDENHFRLRVANGTVADVEFNSSTNGKPREFIDTRIVDGKLTRRVFTAVPDFTPSAIELKEYAGIYRSPEIEPVYEMRVEDGQLVLHRLKNDPDVLRPFTRDVFDGRLGTIQFKRDATGQVTGFAVSTRTDFNLRFEKADR